MPENGRSSSGSAVPELKLCGTHNFITSISRRFEGDPLVIAPPPLHCLILALATEVNPGDNPGCTTVALARSCS